MTIEKLKELEQVATKRPWKRGQFSINVVDTLRGRIVVNHEGRGNERDDRESLEHDCDLVATLRNVAHEMIAVVEAAEKARGQGVTSSDDDYLTLPRKAYEAMAEALYALHAKLAQEKCP